MEGRRRLGEGRPLNSPPAPVNSGHWLHPSFPRRGSDHSAPSPDPGFETNQRRGSLQRGDSCGEWGPVNRCRTIRTKGRGVHQEKGGNLCLTVVLGALKACEGSGVATDTPTVDRGWLGCGRGQSPPWTVDGWWGGGGQETQRCSDLSTVAARRGKGELCGQGQLSGLERPQGQPRVPVAESQHSQWAAD